MSYKIAVVGATGNVGREMLSILDSRKFPASEVVALASKNSKGRDKAEAAILLRGKVFASSHISLISGSLFFNSRDFSVFLLPFLYLICAGWITVVWN